MKIENLTNDGITFTTTDGEAATVRPGETLDLKVKADDPLVVAHLNAGNIRLSGRGAPKDPESAPAAAPETPAE